MLLKLRNSEKKVVSRFNLRRLTSFVRILPDFIIIGTSKSGTTTLYSYLQQHPYIQPSYSKEIDYFDKKFDKGIMWYKSFFDTRIAKFFKQKQNRNYLTGHVCDAFYHKKSAKRIKETLPNVKLILILRDPISRAASHYNQSVKKNREKLKFNEAINLQLKNDCGVEEKKLLHFSKKFNVDPENFYLSAGIYSPRLENFLKFFNKTNLLIIKSEDLFSDPKNVLNDICKYLEIPNYQNIDYQHLNVSEKIEIEPSLKKELENYYKKYNSKLEELAGSKFNWF